MRAKLRRNAHRRPSRRRASASAPTGLVERQDDDGEHAASRRDGPNVTPPSERQLMGEAAYIIRDAISRLNVNGERIPLRWPIVLDALNRSLSADGHRKGGDLSALKTTKQLAAEW